MPATDLDLLVEAAHEAGEIALRYTGPDARRWDKADGAGPVTEADLAVDAHLSRVLRAARPDYGWLSEETDDDPARLSASRVFIVDPIDGTRAFIDGSRDWAHSLAVAEGGVVTAACVHMPMRGLTYAAARGQGATRDGRPIRASGIDRAEDACVLTAKPTLAAKHWAAGEAPGFRRTFRSSLAYRLCLVADGSFDAMLTLRPTWEWDIAAGTLIVEEAGGRATTRRGQPLRFNTPDPRLDGVVAGGAVQGALLEALV